MDVNEDPNQNPNCEDQECAHLNLRFTVYAILRFFPIYDRRSTKTKILLRTSQLLIELTNRIDLGNYSLSPNEKSFNERIKKVHIQKKLVSSIKIDLLGVEITI